MVSVLSRWGIPVLASLAILLLGGCAGSAGGAKVSGGGGGRFYTAKKPNEAGTRRGVEASYVSSPAFGAPRGRQFEDVIPVGARIIAVHVAYDGAVKGIWLTFERNGKTRETPVRGTRTGRVQTLKLGNREKIVGIHGYAENGALQEISIGTSTRVASLGRPGSSSTRPWYRSLTRDQQRQYLGVGISGRADDQLRQVSLRIQVRD